MDIAAQLIDFRYGDGIEVALGGGRIKFLSNIMGGYPTRGNPILGKIIPNDPSGKSSNKLKLMDDEKPLTTLGYYVGPGASWVGGPRPDLTEVDTVNDKAFIQQAAMPAEDDTHGGEDVAVYARGPGSEGVHGVMEQNEIFHVMDAAAKLSTGASD